MIDYKSIILKVLPFLAIAGVGVLVGWYVKPTAVKVEEKEKVVEKQVTTEAIKELMKSFESLRVEMQRVRETQITEKYHREELEAWLADGSHTKKVTVDKNIDSHTKETETKVEVKVVEVEKKVETVKTVYVDKIIEKEKKVTPVLAQWHVGLLAGIKPTFIPLEAGALQLGGEVERRIAGPFFLGLQVSASPVKFDGVQFMGKLGFEF